MAGSRTNRSRNGFVLIIAAASAVTMAAVLGLIVDMGRIRVVQKELQSYADSAAVTAALEMNGHESGLNRAFEMVDSSQNAWNFGTEFIKDSQRSIEFSPTQTGDSKGAWHALPSESQAAGEAYVRVTVTVPVRMFFAPLVTGKYDMKVTASAVAGRTPAASMAARGVLPFAVPAPDADDSETFGLVRGRLYPLRWTFKARSLAEIEEWTDLGFPEPLRTGGTLELTDFANEAEQVLHVRVESDADPSSKTFAAYEELRQGGRRAGNGRRVVALPVVSNGSIIAIGAFFLGTDGHDVEFAGTYAQGANAHSGGGTAMTAQVRLIQ